jgi:hypothetical protein
VSILSIDLEFRYSVPEASAGNQLAQGYPADSLGGWLSTTVKAAAGLLNDLFEDIDGDDNASYVTEYRCLFFLNKNGTFTLTSAVVWLSGVTAGGANIAIGVDPTAASALNSNTVQALAVLNVNTEPPGVDFSAPTTSGAGLSLGDIPPGSCKAIWIRRAAANTAALSNDSLGLSCQGNSL